MLVLSFGSISILCVSDQSCSILSDNSATTFGASRTLPIFLCSLTAHNITTAKTNCWSPNLWSSPHGGSCKSHFPSYVWRQKRTKTKLVLNGCNVVGAGGMLLHTQSTSSTHIVKSTHSSGDGNEYHCNHGCNQRQEESPWGTPRATL